MKDKRNGTEEIKEDKEQNENQPKKIQREEAPQIETETYETEIKIYKKYQQLHQTEKIRKQ